MYWLDDLVAMYAADGLGTPTVDMFASSMSIPKLSSGTVVSFIETGGTSPDYTQNLTTKPAQRNPSAMVMVRGVDYASARTRAEAFYTKATRTNETINGTFYLKIRPLNEPTDQKPDERGNARVSFNILGKCRA